MTSGRVKRCGGRDVGRVTMSERPTTPDERSDVGRVTTLEGLATSEGRCWGELSDVEARHRGRGRRWGGGEAASAGRNDAGRIERQRLRIHFVYSPHLSTSFFNLVYSPHEVDERGKSKVDRTRKQTPTETNDKKAACNRDRSQAASYYLCSRSALERSASYAHAHA